MRWCWNSPAISRARPPPSCHSARLSAPTPARRSPERRRLWCWTPRVILFPGDICSPSSRESGDRPARVGRFAPTTREPGPKASFRMRRAHWACWGPAPEPGLRRVLVSIALVLRPKRRKVVGLPPPQPTELPSPDELLRKVDERNSWRKTPRQHRGPITRTDAKVLLTIRSFVDEQTGRCFPSYEAIAKRAGCSRISVARAIKKLENEGFLTWTHGIQPVPVDDPEVTRLFGKQYDMERTSNLYQIRGATPVLSAEAPEVDRGKNDTRVYGNLTFYSYPRKKKKPTRGNPIAGGTQAGTNAESPARSTAPKTAIFSGDADQPEMSAAISTIEAANGGDGEPEVHGSTQPLHPTPPYDAAVTDRFAAGRRPIGTVSTNSDHPEFKSHSVKIEKKPESQNKIPDPSTGSLGSVANRTAVIHQRWLEERRRKHRIL